MTGPDRAAPTEFEQGPIRPPSEATSLLVRVTRNCPWNRCGFCPVYKGSRFSLRERAEVEADIAAMARLARRLEAVLAEAGFEPPGDADQVVLDRRVVEALEGVIAASGAGAGGVQVARFVLAGGRTVFLQDANSVIMPADDLVSVLETLRAAFPRIDRVTSYARSHTLRLRSVEELGRLRAAGLDRIHVGLESGSDRVLALIDKGITAERHIEAGRRVKQAGMELSEYVMPGLGGRALSEEHAVESARVLREIDPHFIRLRSLAISSGTPLAALRDRGEFEQLDDVEVARELHRFLSGLTGMTGAVRSDHILNLLEEVEGQLPGDLPRMLAAVDRFLALDGPDQETFLVARRLGLVRALSDLDRPELRARAEAARDRIKEKVPGPLAAAIRELTRRFV